MNGNSGKLTFEHHRGRQLFVVLVHTKNVAHLCINVQIRNDQRLRSWSKRLTDSIKCTLWLRRMWPTTQTFSPKPLNFNLVVSVI